MSFTLGMMAARLVLGAVASLCAGALVAGSRGGHATRGDTARASCSSGSRPAHYQIWSDVPAVVSRDVLPSLLVLPFVGAALIRRNAAARPDPRSEIDATMTPLELDRAFARAAARHTRRRCGADGRRTTSAARPQRARNWSRSSRTRVLRRNGRSTARPRDHRSSFPTVQRPRACRGFACGCGMASSAARSGFAGNRERPRCRPTCSVISVTRWFRGKGDGGTRRRRSASSCPCARGRSPVR